MLGETPIVTERNPIVTTEQDREGAAEQYIDTDSKPVPADGLGVSAEALTTNATSIFWMMRDRNIPGGGPRELTFQPSSDSTVIIRDDSQVAVSVTELHPQGFPKLGAATLQVLNVVPRAGTNGARGTITVRFHSTFTNLVPGRFNIIIVN